MEAREKLLALVEAGGVDLHGLEAHGLKLRGQGGACSFDAFDGLDGQLGGGNTEGGPLEADVSTVGFQLVGEAGEELDGLVRHGAAIGGHGEGLAFHPDHAHASLGEVHVILPQLVGVSRQICGAAGRAFHHTVFDLQRAELPRREEGGEIRGVLAVVVVLRIDERLVDHVAVASASRAGELIAGRGGCGLGRAACQARSGQSCADGSQSCSAQKGTTGYVWLSHGLLLLRQDRPFWRSVQRGHSIMSCGELGRIEDATGCNQAFLLRDVFGRISRDESF